MIHRSAFLQNIKIHLVFISNGFHGSFKHSNTIMGIIQSPVHASDIGIVGAGSPTKMGNKEQPVVSGSNTVGFRFQFPIRFCIIKDGFLEPLETKTATRNICHWLKKSGNHMAREQNRLIFDIRLIAPGQASKHRCGSGTIETFSFSRNTDAKGGGGLIATTCYHGNSRNKAHKICRFARQFPCNLIGCHDIRELVSVHIKEFTKFL